MHFEYLALYPLFSYQQAYLSSIVTLSCTSSITHQPSYYIQDLCHYHLNSGSLSYPHFLRFNRQIAHCPLVLILQVLKSPDRNISYMFHPQLVTFDIHIHSEFCYYRHHPHPF